jgi:hypothetical protein
MSFCSSDDDRADRSIVSAIEGIIWPLDDSMNLLPRSSVQAMTIEQKEASCQQSKEEYGRRISHILLFKS